MAHHSLHTADRLELAADRRELASDRLELAAEGDEEDSPLHLSIGPSAPPFSVLH
jgi:hypothetical protein